jgi:hypothetical protein
MATFAFRFNPSASNPHPSHPQDARLRKDGSRRTTGPTSRRGHGPGPFFFPSQASKLPPPRKQGRRINRSIQGKPAIPPEEGSFHQKGSNHPHQENSKRRSRGQLPEGRSHTTAQQTVKIPHVRNSCVSRSRAQRS